jgi:hypothetical protein
MFGRNKEETSMKPAAVELHAGFLLGLLFNQEDGGSVFLRNVGWLSPDYMALCPRRYITLSI